MLLGAIFDDEPPLRARIKAALKINPSPVTGKRPKLFRANAPFDPGRLGISAMVQSALITVALFSVMFFMVAVDARGMFGSLAEHDAIQFIDDHRLVILAFAFGPLIISLSTIAACGMRNRRLEGVLSEMQSHITHTIGGRDRLWRWNQNNLLWFTDQTSELLRLAPATDYNPAKIAALLNPDDQHYYGTRSPQQASSVQRSMSVFARPRTRGTDSMAAVPRSFGD